MQRCQNCGTELPENAQFCSQCGFAQSATTNTRTYFSNFTNYEDMMQQSTGGAEEEERRRRMLLGLPLLGAITGDAQLSAGNVPVVQGPPSMGGVPIVQGTPPIGGASSHELFHAGTPPQPQFVQQMPVSQPGQMPPTTPPVEFYHTAPPLTYHPVAPLKLVPKKGLGSIPIWVVIPVVIIIIIGGIFGTIFIILPPSLTLSSDTISGGTLHLHGSHFFPGGNVALTLDQGQVLTLDYTIPQKLDRLIR